MPAQMMLIEGSWRRICGPVHLMWDCQFLNGIGQRQLAG
jgi:hypothetical protein